MFIAAPAATDNALGLFPCVYDFCPSVANWAVQKTPLSFKQEADKHVTNASNDNDD